MIVVSIMFVVEWLNRWVGAY